MKIGTRDLIAGLFTNDEENGWKIKHSHYASCLLICHIRAPIIAYDSARKMCFNSITFVGFCVSISKGILKRKK
jgi:hypothetical protein